MLEHSLRVCRACKAPFVTGARLQHLRLGAAMASKLYPPLSLEGWTVLITGTLTELRTGNGHRVVCA